MLKHADGSKMSKKIIFSILQIVIAIFLVAFSFFIRSEDLKAVSGICLGIGCGLFGMNVAQLVIKHYEKKNPKIRKQNEIDAADERNVLINSKAKAKAGDIVQWFIIGIAYILILIDVPLWTILIVVGVYVLYYILQFYYIGKYQKEM